MTENGALVDPEFVLARMEARQGTDPQGLDGEAATAGIAPKPNDINTIPQEGTEP